ncbi:MAG: hypothetical protein ACRYFU_16325 [Janthinobacterium lividum]
MRLFTFSLRVLLLLSLFVGVGLWSAHAILLHAVAQGRPEYTVRLAAYMTGLFVGGSASTVAGVLMLLSGKRASPGNHEPHERDETSS